MKAITLSGEEKKVLSNGSTVVKIKDEKGLTYSFFQKKQDGSDSKAYEGYQNFQLGDTVEIHYSEQQRTTPDGKAYTARNVAFFGEKVQSHNVPQSPVSEANRGQSGDSNRGAGTSNDAFGRRLGVQGHINALLSNSSIIVGVALDKARDWSHVVKWAIEIEEEAEKQLNPSAFRQAVQKAAPQVVEDLPVIQQEDDVDALAESVPF